MAYLKDPFLRIYFLLFLTLDFRIVTSYTVTGYEIRDLESTVEADFVNEVQQWTHPTLKSGVTQAYSSCPGVFLMGGYNVLQNNNSPGADFVRSYTSLQTHTRIDFSIDIWIIDSWDYMDRVILLFDTTQIDTVPTLAFDNSAYSSLTHTCGNPIHRDVGRITVTGTVAHSSNSLTFKIRTTTDSTSDIESAGFRNVYLRFSSTTPPGTPYVCGNPAASITLPSHDCSCPNGSYSDSGSCTGCNAVCKTCFDGGATDCYQCADNHYFDGNQCSPNTTPTPGPTPTSTPIPIPTPTPTPAACSNGFIFDIDNTCKQCDSMSVEYIRSNDKGHVYQLKLSPSQCDLDQVFVQNNLQGVPVPDFSFKVNKLSQNFYQVNIELSESLVKSTDLNLKLDYLQAVMSVPKKFVPSETLQKVESAAKKAQTAISAALGASIAGTAALGATAALWSIISFQQFVGYFSKINVEFPFQVSIFFSLSNSVSWDIFPNPLRSVTSGLSKEIVALEGELAEEYHPPSKFMESDMTSFFIENAGLITVTNIGLLFLLGIINMVQNVPFLKTNRMLKIIKSCLRWNVIARTFLENGIPLTLAIFLQIRALDFTNAYLIICSSLAFISIIYMMIMIVSLLTVLYSFSSKDLESKQVDNIYGTLYEGMSIEEKSKGKYYHFIIFFRGILLVLFVSFLEDLPILQILPLIFYNMGLIYYLFKAANFHDKKLNLINRAKEILILFGEVMIFCLFIQIDSIIYYEVIGWLIVGALGGSLVIELMYIIGIQIMGIREIGRKILRIYQIIKIWLTVSIRMNNRVQMLKARSFRRLNSALSENT